MRAIRTVAILFTLGAPLLASAASTPGQQKIDDGKALAQKYCAACHVVDSQGGGTDAVPSFAAAAASRSDDFLHTQLMKPHGKMPPVDLTNDQIDALVAYIESLKK